MKLETKVALINLASAIEQLAAGVILHTGIETASSVISATHCLKEALNKESIEPTEPTTKNETSKFV